MSDQETSFGIGQVLFKQGEKGGDLYFIKTGQIELTVRSEAGETAVVAVLGERSVIGTMSFLEGEPRSATAKCLSEVKAVVIFKSPPDAIDPKRVQNANKAVVKV